MNQIFFEAPCVFILLSAPVFGVNVHFQIVTLQTKDSVAFFFFFLEAALKTITRGF